MQLFVSEQELHISKISEIWKKIQVLGLFAHVYMKLFNTLEAGAKGRCCYALSHIVIQFMF